jgi:hypothetical protein
MVSSSVLPPALLSLEQATHIINDKQRKQKWFPVQKIYFEESCS